MNIIESIYSIFLVSIACVVPVLILIAAGFSLKRLIKNRGQRYPKRFDDTLLVVVTSLLLILAVIIIAVLTNSFTQSISFM